MHGDRRFNSQKFIVASAKSQSGNLMGMVGGAGAAFILAGSLTAAPLILVSLGAGIFVQMLWGASGMSDSSAALAQRAFKP